MNRFIKFYVCWLYCHPQWWITVTRNNVFFKCQGMIWQTTHLSLWQLMHHWHYVAGASRDTCSYVFCSYFYSRASKKSSQVLFKNLRKLFTRIIVHVISVHIKYSHTLFFLFTSPPLFISVFVTDTTKFTIYVSSVQYFLYHIFLRYLHIFTWCLPPSAFLLSASCVICYARDAHESFPMPAGVRTNLATLARETVFGLIIVGLMDGR